MSVEHHTQYKWDTLYHDTHRHTATNIKEEEHEEIHYDLNTFKLREALSNLMTPPPSPSPPKKDNKKQTNQKTAQHWTGLIRRRHGWDFSGYSQISWFKYLSESNKNCFETHFEYGFSPVMIQTLTWFHPWEQQLHSNNFRSSAKPVEEKKRGI